jgi:hypothetical protein
VEGKLEGKAMQMIVDTGSNISIVTPQLLRNLAKDLSCVQPVPNCLKSVTGEKLNLLGTITLKFAIGNREILQSFYVADISESCILGLDFLQQQRCQLNITDGILSMGNVQVPLLHPLTDDLNMLCYRVIALEDINIQPHTEAVILRKWLITLARMGGESLNPLTRNLFLESSLVKFLTKLTNETTVVPIRMVNVTEEKRKILAGTDLAKCETVSFIVCPDFENCFEESTTRNEIPKHLAELYESNTKDLVYEDQRNKVFDLLCENATVFSSNSSYLGRTDIVKHQITTGSAKPIKQPPRRLPLAKRDVACQAGDKMLKDGVIEPSTSPWSSPVVLVAKKNGSLSFC